MAIWRVRLDVPHTHCIRPAMGDYRHAQEMILQGADAQPPALVMREPVTGLWMLRPQAADQYDYEDINAWTTAPNTALYNASWWIGVRKGLDPPAYALPPLMASVRPAGETASGIELSPVPAVGLSHAVETGRSGDTLLWALQSNFFDLRRDGSFSISWSMVADGLADHRNGFAVQWHDWQVALYPGGRVRVWRWSDPADIDGTPTLVDEWVVDEAVAERSGYLTVIPVPNWGLLVYLAAPTCLERNRGHMVAAEMLSDVLGSHYWPEETAIRVAINPGVKWVLGYSAVRFPATDQVVYDAPFDVEQPPLTAPSSIPVTNLGDAVATSASVEIVKPDRTSVTWASETERTTYRAKITLSNGSDPYLTPFFASYQPLWPAVFETRATTEWEAEVVSNLSITDTADGRVEGACDVQVWSELGRKALERGDMSVVVESRAEDALGEEPWDLVLHGLATVEGDVSVDYDVGRDRLIFGARLALRDMRYRLSEIRMTEANSLDGLTVVEAINRILGACGFEELLSTPSGVDETEMPVATQDGKRPRWMPKRGDDGERVLRDLLLLLRRKNKEYNVVQAVDDANPANRHRLKMVERERETDPLERWTLSLLGGQHDPATKVVECGALTLSPSPPEANAVRVESYDEKSNLKAVTKVAVNQDSLDDPSSRDYLGRMKLLVAHVQGIDSEAELKKAARRLYDAVAHNRLTATVTTPWYVEELASNAYARVRGLDADGAEAALLDGWVVRRTVTVTAEESDESSGHERVTYEIDTVWSGRAS